MADVGQVLAGRYRIAELVGQGGMATIYRGNDAQLGRDVAIKVLRSEYGRDPAFVARFRQEAQAAAALTHPNVVNVYDYGMEAGDPFIVMELIDGGDLGGLIHEQGALEPVAAARIAQQIFEALDTAHARGIVHRDIKPTNVLLTGGGRVKVADFGIARAFSEAQLTMPGTTLGSVHYFSPEQARGEMVTTASDVYSAGLVLFEMLTGRRAWTGDSAGAVAVARLSGDPPAPSSIQPGIPPALDIAVRRALSRIPAHRPTAGEMAAMLGRYIVDPSTAIVDADSAPGIGSAGAAAAGAGVAGAVGVGVAAAGQAGSDPGQQYAAPDNQEGYADDYAEEPVYEAGAPYGAARGGVPARQMAYSDQPRAKTAGPWGWVAAVLGVLVLFAGGALLFLLLSSRPGPGASPGASGALFTLRSFVGQQLDAAQNQADDLGLIMTVGSYQLSDESAEGTIIRQDPAAGGQVGRGSRVSVTVASSRVTVFVPDFRLRTEAELFAQLSANELLPGTRSEEFDPEVPATLIVRTNPRSDVEVARGTSVDYVVSLGPQPSPTAPPPETISPFPTPTPTPTPIPTEVPTPPPPPTLSPAEPPTPTPTLPPTLTPTLPPTPEPTPEPTPVSVLNYATCGSLGEARVQIAAAGLVVGVVFPAEAADDWQVAEQDPPSGSEVPPGTEVHLYVKSPADACP